LASVIRIYHDAQSSECQELTHLRSYQHYDQDCIITITISLQTQK